MLDILRHLHVDQETAVFNALDHLDVADARQIESFGNLGPDLRRIAVRRLQAADDQVELAELLDALRKRVARCENVRAAERAVGNDRALVCAHGKRFIDDSLCLRRSHRDDTDTSAILLLEKQAALESKQVIRVHLGIGAVALQDARHRIDFNLVRTRDLFDTYENFHNYPSIYDNVTKSPTPFMIL